MEEMHLREDRVVDERTVLTMRGDDSQEEWIQSLDNEKEINTRVRQSLEHDCR